MYIHNYYVHNNYTYTVHVEYMKIKLCKVRYMACTCVHDMCMQFNYGKIHVLHVVHVHVHVIEKKM